MVPCQEWLKSAFCVPLCIASDKFAQCILVYLFTVRPHARAYAYKEVKPLTYTIIHSDLGLWCLTNPCVWTIFTAMAARHNIRHDLATRERIQTSQLVNRLRDCALGEIVMDAVQVRAAEILLAKTLPNLASVESNITAAVTTISAEPLSEAEFMAKFDVADKRTPEAVQ